MIRWILKYGAVIFLVNIIFLSIASTIPLGEIIFLILMGIFLCILLINPYHIKTILLHRAFTMFLGINILNIIYFSLFHSFKDVEAIQYLLAKTIQFLIISCSIYYNYEYYKSKFLLHLVYMLTIVILISLLVDVDIFSGRYSGIVWNPNMLASFTSIGFAILLLYQKASTKLDLSLLFLFLIISLSTGSRGVLLALSLAFLFRFRFSFRNIIYLLLILFSYYGLTTLHLDTSVNRFISQELLNDRLLQYQYAFETFLDKPLFGYGLDKYSYINLELVPYYLNSVVIGAHNGYLALLVQYGLIFGLVIIGIIIYQYVSFYFTFDRNDSAQLVYIYIITYALIASLYESLLTGINEFHTFLFWFSYGFLLYTSYKKKYAN